MGSLKFEEQIYWKRLGQRELLVKILDLLDSRRISIEELRQRLRKMLVVIEEELSNYIVEIDNIYYVLETEASPA